MCRTRANPPRFTTVIEYDAAYGGIKKNKIAAHTVTAFGKFMPNANTKYERHKSIVAHRERIAVAHTNTQAANEIQKEEKKKDGVRVWIWPFLLDSLYQHIFFSYRSSSVSLYASPALLLTPCVWPSPTHPTFRILQSACEIRILNTCWVLSIAV